MLIPYIKYLPKKFSRVCFVISMFPCIISCSKYNVIVKDYKLYDLDGSNQAIIGRSGMTAIHDVTSYKMYQDKILFETGVINSKNINRIELCLYGYININDGSVVNAKYNSKLSNYIRARLVDSSEGIVSRSCAATD